MRNTLKKWLAAVLACALCLNFAGCYSENNTWAAKKGDDTMPIGGYIYDLYLSYTEAAAEIGNDTEVLKGAIDGKDAATWIKDRALAHLKGYYYIVDKFNELGLEMTEEDLSSIESNVTSAWSYYQTTMETMGIARDSFEKASYYYSTMTQKVFEVMYGEGGEKAVSDDELKTYFNDNYSRYEYFTVSLTTTDDEGNSVSLTDEEKAAIKEKLQGYADDINAGKNTVEEAATAYATETDGDSTYNAPTPSITENLTSTFKNALTEMEDGKASFVETDSAYYVVGKLPIADGFADYIADDDQRLTLLSTMKSEEYSDFILEQGESVADLTINTSAINGISVNTVVNDNNKNGTSSVASEAESSGE